MKKLLLVVGIALALTGCKKEPVGCDASKYNCSPVATASSEVVVSSEPTAVASEPLDAISEDTVKAYQDDALPPAPSSKEVLKMIKAQQKTLIKQEMNTVMGTNYNGWNVMINSIKPDPREPGVMWIINYDVSTGEKGILSDECEAKAFVSGEDNTTLILATIDTECYSFLKQYVQGV